MLCSNCEAEGDPEVNVCVTYSQGKVFYFLSFVNIRRSCDTEGKKKNKRELERIEYQTKGAILPSNSRWCNEDQKNTKHFLNLEKRRCKQATITQL